VPGVRRTGPRRPRLRAVVLDAPAARCGTSTGWVAERRAEDFTLDADTAVAAVRRHEPAVTFLTTPNNPTGTVTPLEVVDAVCEASAGMVLVDEAYAEFASGPSAVTLLDRHPRLMVSRTMSKAFALAGARLGYLAASADVVDVLRLVRLPYHLSALTQAAARVALSHADELLSTVAAVTAQRDRMVARSRPSACGSCRPRRTSCCSAPSTGLPRCGRRCSSAACWCAT
jgi:histidinol-phosphate aminotransferase